MNLYIQYKIKQCGKSKFLTRLIPELEKIGVKVQWKERGADIALLITRNREKMPKCPKVIRLDGITLLDDKKNKWRIKKKILPAVNKCQAIIYQSDFAKYMLNGIMKPKVKKQYVIFNGDNPKHYEKVVPIESPFEKNIIISSKWFDRELRVHKRLHKMWEIAQYYNALRSSNCCFWIAGETGGIEKKWLGFERIKILGHLPDNVLKRYLKMADIYLHLSWFSWCDNSLIEAICAGCIPVVNNQGGSFDIVSQTGGAICGIDDRMRAKRLRSTIPPVINNNIVLDTIDDVYKHPGSYKIDVGPIHIKNIAKQYKKVFEEVLNG